MESNLTIGETVKFQSATYKIIDIFKPLGTYEVYKLKRAGEIKQAFRYQIENNFFDSDDDEFLSTINIDDLTSESVHVPIPTTSSTTPTSQCRFPEISTDEIDKIKSAKDEKSTDYATKWGVKVFTEWLTSRGISAEFGCLSVNPTQLNNHLRQFYAEARTKDGREYSKSALVGIRASINRHIQAPPFKSIINIMKDREFTSSNHVLMGVIKEQRRQGKDVTKHKDAISSQDLKKLFDSDTLSCKTPLSLVRKVWFDIMYHFGRRGREGLRNLRVDSFRFQQDDTGSDFVVMAFNETDKTHHGVDSREREKAGRMYASGDDRCPVASLHLYLSKRSPLNDAFFQRPLSKVSPTSECWFYNQAMGVKTLSSMMSDISHDAGLSQRYTNHCLRATCATVLNDAGVDVRGIMNVTGHRNESSVRSYVQRPSVDQRRSLSSLLHSAIASTPSSSAPCLSLQSASTSSSQQSRAPSSTVDAVSHTVTNQSLTQVHMQKLPQGLLQNATITGGTFNFSFHC